MMADIPIGEIPAAISLLKALVENLGLPGVRRLMQSRRTASEDGQRIAEAREQAQIKQIEAEAQVQRALTASKGLAEIKTILGEGPIELIADLESMLNRQADRRMRNMAGVVEKALAALGDEVVEDCQPDTDWMTHFINDGQDVSSEELQELWARILAQEVRDPGAISRRTLTALKHLSRDDAERFAALRPFILTGTKSAGVIPAVPSESRKGDLSVLNVDNLIRVQDSGLMVHDTMLKSTYSSSKFPHSSDDSELAFAGYQNGFLVFPTDAGGSVSVPVMPLTTAGSELAGIIPATDPHMQFLRVVAALVHKDNDQEMYLLNDFDTEFSPSEKILDRATLIAPGE